MLDPLRLPSEAPPLPPLPSRLQRSPPPRHNPHPDQREVLIYLQHLERKGFEPEAYLNEDRLETRKQHWVEGKKVWYSTFIDTGTTIHVIVNRQGGLPPSPKRVRIIFRDRGRRRDPNCQFLKDQRNPPKPKDFEKQVAEEMKQKMIAGLAVIEDGIISVR